jgi:O-methyltransferase
MYRFRYAVKYMLAPVLYRHAPFGLAPERLAIYLNCLLEKSHVPGDVAEIGCNIAGTAVIASKIVERFSPQKSYICYDTFQGFVDDQFDVDLTAGTPGSLRKYFSANSEKLAKRILRLHGRNDVVLVKGDATKLTTQQLRDKYSVILLDVDLSEPTYKILELFYPRLSSGGVILIDDCIEGNDDWKAIIGYRRFCAEQKLAEEYRYGFGIVSKS